MQLQRIIPHQIRLGLPATTWSVSAFETFSALATLSGLSGLGTSRKLLLLRSVKRRGYSWNAALPAKSVRITAGMVG